MTGKRDALAAKCEEFALEVLCMPGIAEEASSLRTRLAELEDASKRKASRVEAKSRTLDVEVVFQQAYREHVLHAARTAQWDGDLHNPKGKLDI